MRVAAYALALAGIVAMIVFVLATPRIEAWMMRGIDGDAS